MVTVYENIINKLTKANYVVELHGKDEAKKFSKICREHFINTDFLIRSFECKEIHLLINEYDAFLYKDGEFTITTFTNSFIK